MLFVRQAGWEEPIIVPVLGVCFLAFLLAITSQKIFVLTFACDYMTVPRRNSNSIIIMASFQERLQAELCPNGYEPCMRRSVQSCILFEAYRCVEGKLEAMRPFQRKLAFLDQAVALLNSLDFIPPHQKPDVMWRTATSREPITDDSKYTSVTHFY